MNSKRLSCMLSSVLFLACSGVVRAQTADTSERRTNSQIIDSILTPLEKRILDLAEAMPAEKYSFAPTCGEFKGVRTFGEQLKHIAADLYLDGAAILGENPPGDVETGETGSRAVRSKPEIIAYVKASFEYMHRAAAAIDDANAPVPKPGFLPYGKDSTTRLHIAIADIGHTNDHYGQLVEYLRMNGIIPPASRRQPAGATEKLGKANRSQ